MITVMSDLSRVNDISVRKTSYCLAKIPPLDALSWQERRSRKLPANDGPCSTLLLPGEGVEGGVLDSPGSSLRALGRRFPCGSGPAAGEGRDEPRPVTGPPLPRRCGKRRPPRSA